MFKEKENKQRTTMKPWNPGKKTEVMVKYKDE